MVLARLIVLLVLTAGTPAQMLCQHRHESVLTKKYSPEALREDATIFRDVILAMHPAVGLYEPREYYVRLLDSLVGSIHDSLTEKQFRLGLKLVADELHCGHTEVIYSSAYYKEMKRIRINYSPFVFIPVHDKVFLLASLNKKMDTLMKRGSEITSINGVTMDSMLRYARRFISSDGYNQTAKNHYLQLGFNGFYVGLFGRPDTFTVEYIDSRQQPRTIKYAAFKPKSFPTLPLGPRDDSLFTRFKRASVMYRYLTDDKKTAMVRIGRFSHRGYGKAYRRIFRRLDRHDTRNLVLDLRSNGGGSLANAYKLLSYLIDTAETQTLRTGIRNYPLRRYTHGNIGFKLTRLAYRVIGKKYTHNDTDDFVYTIRPHRRHHFDGRLFVLINGGSFSASSLVCAYLHYRHRAEFIGEETGGTLEGCNAGVTPYYRLPNTGIRVRMPAFRIVHDVSPGLTGQGILPDYPVQYSFGDIVGRRDLELQKVKELLKIP